MLEHVAQCLEPALARKSETENGYDRLDEAMVVVIQNQPAILAAVADFYGTEATSLSRRHDPHLARAVAAWLCRRHTEATLASWPSGWGFPEPTACPT